jgi:lysophospholipase L1-like esterase
VRLAGINSSRLKNKEEKMGTGISHINSITLVLMLVFLVMLVLVSVVMLVTSNSFKKNAETERGVKTAGLSVMNETAKEGQTVFAGDSITENYRVAEFFTAYTAETGGLVYNRGISGEVSGELAKRFEENVLTLRPCTIVILIGTNDLAGGVEPAAIVKNIEQMMSLARSADPETKIILQAVYPTNPAVTPAVTGRIISLMLHGRRTAASIGRLNELLRQKAKEYSAVWLDLTALLADETGKLNEKFTFDGLHLNAAGYWIVTENLAPLLH